MIFSRLSTNAPHAPIPPAPVPSGADVRSVKILPLSDLHLPNSPKLAQKIVDNRPYLERMDTVVLLGDMVSMYGTDREYRALEKWLKQLKRPYAAINGNHEFYAQPFEEGTPRHGSWTEQDAGGKARQLEKFKAFFGMDSLWSAQHTPLGSFIFLGLDDVENTKVENLSDAQFSWLEEQLKFAPERPAFVFCHAPLMLDERLDMTYYEAERTACIEPPTGVLQSLKTRLAPTFWVSGHIHLHPDHYLFDAYPLVPSCANRTGCVWQIHCPDSWGYSRWKRRHSIPQRHGEVFSRHLEISRDAVVIVTHDHAKREDVNHQMIPLAQLESRVAQ